MFGERLPRLRDEALRFELLRRVPADQAADHHRGSPRATMPLA